jgi:hypothetical protein
LFDLLSLLIGVNNPYRGRDPQEYRSRFQELPAQDSGPGDGASDPGLERIA